MTLKIAGAALNQTAIDWENNCNNIISAINQAQSDGVDILCLPELCITGYGCEDLFLSNWLPEKAMECLLLLLKHTKNITVSIGLPIVFNDTLYNCCCLIHDTKILGFTAKQFLANDGVHYETRWFNPWNSEKREIITINGKTYPFGDLIYEVNNIKIAFEICEDAWRPNRPGIKHAEKKVDLILNPSASHFAFGKSHIRYDIVINGSKNFNCAYVYADLLGNETGRMIFDGEVLIAYKGKLIQRNDRLSFKDVNLVSTEIDFQKGISAETVLTHDDLEKEFEFWEATCLGLFDYMRKSHSKGFVLSLSGGADSSACAIMVSEMVKKGLSELGPEIFLKKAGIENQIQLSTIKTLPLEEQAKKIINKILICAYQSTKNSGQETFDSAKSIAEYVGATFYSWSVGEEVESYTKKIETAIGRKLEWSSDDITLQNIQARSRAPIIWMLANIHRFLLITTSNRSEGDVGYATMDGDTAGSIAPIAGVDKHFIRQWLIWAEKNKNATGLNKVNNLQPTAELRPAEKTQTDEDDLMPYHILAAIEREAIRNRKSPTEVYHLLKRENDINSPHLKKHITKFFRLWAINQWKRERIAPSFHLDDFNVDPKTWCRFPILNGGFQQELKALDLLD